MTTKKLAPLTAILAVFIFLTGCGDYSSQDSAAARRLLDGYFRLKDFDQEGVFFTSFSSRSKELRPRLKNSSRASSFSPDLRSFSTVTFLSTGRFSHIVVRLMLDRGISAEIGNLIYDPQVETPAEAMQMEWASADGSAVLIREHGSLGLATLCGDKIIRTLLAENVYTFSATSQKLYYLNIDSRNVLRWQPLPGIKGSPGSQILPSTYGKIQIGPTPSNVLVFDQNKNGLLVNFLLIETDRGSSLPVAPKDGIENVIQIETLKETKMAAIEIKRDAQEKLDGSINSYLAVWDYGSGAVVPILESGGSLDRLAKNVYFVTEATVHQACDNSAATVQ